MMQPQAEAPPAPPQAPAAPPGNFIVIEGAPGVPAQRITIPLSLGDVRWLRARREELTEHLSEATDRRESITDELVGATGGNRTGLEQQLAQIDQRIVQLTSEITQTEQLLTSAPTSFLAATASRSEPGGAEPEAQVIIPSVLIVFVGFPLAVAYARRIWKRSSTPRVAPADNARLERIEQAVEAIAIEVERVSEGQRFVTKLLSDTSRTPLSLPDKH
ncbi:MAG TPA: hypothetical protein VMY38_04925 [Gemmatimonadaceae bacterium]|nr:hypothetical protein [Gemmatimonadaceae bacterium]